MTTYTPRALAGMVRRAHVVCLAVRAGPARPDACPVPRAAALRLIRRYYRTGQRLLASASECGRVVVIG